MHRTIVEQFIGDQRVQIGVQIDDSGSSDQVDIQIALVAGKLTDELIANDEQQTVRF